MTFGAQIRTFPSIEIDISAYKNSLIMAMYGIYSLEGLKINVGRGFRNTGDIIVKGFKELNEFLRDYNKDNPNYRFDPDFINFDNTNIPYQIDIKWVYSKYELELLHELSEELKKLFGLKRTEVIIDPNMQPRCEPSKEIIICHVKSEDDMIHEMAHAYFRERNAMLIKQLGEQQYRFKIKDIITDKHLEEVTLWFISYNIQHKFIRKCSEYYQSYLKSYVRRAGDIYYSTGYEFDEKSGKSIEIELGEYNDIEIVKKVFRLYGALYDLYCICPSDFEFYKSIRNDVDPLIIYNKLARYVGIRELKDENFLMRKI